jgi:RimJ/RimL family protein N-acetyltransferase
MSTPVLSVREMQLTDIPAVVNYWTTATDAHLTGMGVDLGKMPTAPQFAEMLAKNIQTPVNQRISCCVIWQVDGVAVGHSNTNPTRFGEQAFMHLHLWNSDSRRQGLGTGLVRLSLSYYFETLQLKRLFCEPYALNPAPNKTLARVGFEFVKEYVTTPGYINFEQPVKRWMMSRERFVNLQS